MLQKISIGCHHFHCQIKIRIHEIELQNILVLVCLRLHVKVSSPDHKDDGDIAGEGPLPCVADVIPISDSVGGTSDHYNSLKLGGKVRSYCGFNIRVERALRIGNRVGKDMLDAGRKRPPNGLSNTEEIRIRVTD